MIRLSMVTSMICMLSKANSVSSGAIVFMVMGFGSENCANCWKWRDALRTINHRWDVKDAHGPEESDTRLETKC